MIYNCLDLLETAIQGHLPWGVSCSCIKMPRKRSRWKWRWKPLSPVRLRATRALYWCQVDLQIADCLVFSGECLFSILNHITPNLMAEDNMCHLQAPQVRIWLWLSWMSGVRRGCRLTCWLSWGRIHLLFAQLGGCGQTSVLHRLKDRGPQLLPVGVSTGSSQRGSFLHQNGAIRRARGGGEGGGGKLIF